MKEKTPGRLGEAKTNPVLSGGEKRYVYRPEA